MNNSMVWTCTNCKYIPSAQSSRRCPRCGKKLTLWDLSKAPLNRQPEWPLNKNEASTEKNENRIDYTKFFDKEKE